ncbi:DNA polymerase III subunit delta' C-terminal domain-containing protein [Escherichia coli]
MDNVTDDCLPRYALQAPVRLAQALALLRGDNWQARETLCQALAYHVPSGDWYSLLQRPLIMNKLPARLHWLATLLMDALKRHHRAAQVTMLMCRAWSPNWQTIFLPRACRLEMFRIREQSCIYGINRELLHHRSFYRIEHYLQPALCYRLFSS